MLDLYDKIEAAREHISRAWPGRPLAGIVLGSGLGGLADEIEVEASIPYEEIPHFPTSTVLSHTGRLVCGTLEGAAVVAMQGRFHMYEGYPLNIVTLPVRVMRALGAELLIVSQAVGGLNPAFTSGDVMVINDHINLMGDNPLVGINDDRLGPRFPDMSAPYDPELIGVASEVARREGFAPLTGVVVAVSGPNLETRAEYRFLRSIGADVVGMSTVPETIVGAHCGLRVFGASVVTDMCLPDTLEPADADQIVAVAQAAEPKLRALVMGVLAQAVS